MISAEYEDAVDAIDDVIASISKECSSIKVYTASYKELKRRCTDCFTALRDLDEEDDATLDAALELQKVLGPVLRDVKECTAKSQLQCLANEQEILQHINQHQNDLRAYAGRFELYSGSQLKKWITECTRHETRDRKAIEVVLDELVQNSDSLAALLVLEDKEIQAIAQAFNTRIAETEDPLRAAYQKAVRPLQSQKGYDRLPSLTGRVKILGDNPVTQGPWYELFHAETANENRVMVRVWRPTDNRRHARERVRRLLSEATLWARATHIRIVPFRGLAHVGEPPRLAVVSAWMRQGTIVRYLVEVNPNANRPKILSEIAEGLEYLHSQEIVHGNLRGASVFVNDDESVCVGNLSSSPSAEGAFKFTNRNYVNSRWLAPEVISPASQNAEPDYAADVFSYGRTALEVFSGSRPFPDISGEAAVIRKVLGDNPFPAYPGELVLQRGMTDDVWAFVNTCWDIVPSGRPSATTVVQTMGAFEVVYSLTRDLSSQEEEGPDVDGTALADLSSEIRKLGDYPVAGGGFCDVFQGERMGHEKVALKLLRMFDVPANVRKRFLRETQLWASLRHPNVLAFYGICDYGTSVYMVSPWLDNGCVRHYVSQVNVDANRLLIATEAAEGLLYLHSRRPPVIHGDLKADNILITNDGHAALCDFGLSKISHEVTTVSMREAGSQRWMAPELMNAQEDDEDDYTIPRKTWRTDVYAFGLVILELLSDRVPFFHLQTDLHVMVEVMKGGRPPRPRGDVADEWLTDPIWDFVQRLFAYEASGRPPMQEVVAKLHTLAWQFSIQQSPAIDSASLESGFGLDGSLNAMRETLIQEEPNHEAPFQQILTNSRRRVDSPEVHHTQTRSGKHRDSPETSTRSSRHRDSLETSTRSSRKRDPAETQTRSSRQRDPPEIQVQTRSKKRRDSHQEPPEGLGKRRITK